MSESKFDILLKFLREFARKSVISEDIKSVDLNQRYYSEPNYQLILKDISRIKSITEEFLHLLISNYELILQQRNSAEKDQRFIYNKLLEFYKTNLFSLKFDQSESEEKILQLLSNISINQMNLKIETFTSSEEFKNYQNQLQMHVNQINQINNGETSLKGYPLTRDWLSSLAAGLLYLLGVAVMFVVPWVMWTYYPAIGMGGILITFATIIIVTMPAISFGNALRQSANENYQNALDEALKEPNHKIEELTNEISNTIDADVFLIAEDESSELASNFYENEKNFEAFKNSKKENYKEHYATKNRMHFFNTKPDNQTGTELEEIKKNTL